jgi:hypothetical protein
MALQNKTAVVASLVAVGALVLCGIVGNLLPKPEGSDVAAASATLTATAPPTVAPQAPSLDEIPQAPCVLNAAGKPTVPIFPTVEAAREWIAAIDRDDFEAAEAARKGERAYLVDSGTRCTRLDIDLDVARVRMVTGKRQGEVGWTRREWSFAQGKDD